MAPMSPRNSGGLGGLKHRKLGNTAQTWVEKMQNAFIANLCSLLKVGCNALTMYPCGTKVTLSRGNDNATSTGHNDYVLPLVATILFRCDLCWMSLWTVHIGSRRVVGCGMSVTSPHDCLDYIP